MVDGEKKDRFEDSFFCVFSPDSKRYAYVATKENEWFLVVDDEVTLTLNADNFEDERGLYRYRLEFSTDSKHIYFLTTLKSPSRDILFRDGEKIAEAENIDGIVFSPSGQKIALSAYVSDPVEKLKIDKLNAEFYQEVPTGPLFSISARYADKNEITGEERTFGSYRARIIYEDGDAHALFINGKEIYRTSFRIGAWGIRPHFTPDGNHIVFSILKGNHDPYGIVIDAGEQGDEFRSIKPTPFFSKDKRNFIVFGHDYSRAVWKIEYDLEQFPGIS